MTGHEPSPEAPGLVALRREQAIHTGGESPNAIYALVMRQLESEDASGSVLDFGCGKGLFTSRLVESGRFDRIVAADIIEYPLPADVDVITADLNRPLDLPANSFDVILAIGVLPSLENPYQACRELARLLKPDGALIGTMSNLDSIRALGTFILRGYFPSFSSASLIRVPLPRATLVSALVGAGLREPQWFYSDDERLPIPGTSLTWSRVSRGLLRGPRFSTAVGFVTRRSRSPRGMDTIRP